MTLIRVIDFETRGPMPPHEENEIIEVGWCDVDGGIIGAPASVLVQHALPIDVETMAVHHLQERDFANATWRTAALDGLCRPAADLLGPEPPVLCAHSIKFKRACWPECPAEMRWIDTYKCALRLWPESPRHNNQTLRYFLGFTKLDPALAMPPHRAGPDAYVTAHILVKCLERASAEELIAWSSEPALLPRCTFGRTTRGMLWTEVEDSFLDWVSERDFDEDVLFTVHHEMERRKATRTKERQDALAARIAAEPDDEIPF